MSRVTLVQLKHNQGRMLTRSGKELRNMDELMTYYKTNLDGLPVLLKEVRDDLLTSHCITLHHARALLHTILHRVATASRPTATCPAHMSM